MLIAQITDLHVKHAGKLAYGRVDTYPMLELAVAHLRRLDPQPDVVLLTGDLVDEGSDAEYDRLRDALAPLKQKLYVIPGNHDERAALARTFADHGYLPRGGGFLHYAVDDHPVRLIGLDTLIPGKVGGAMDDARCRWLDARLGEAPDKPTLVMMHHPPFAMGIDHLDRWLLQGADEFGRVIARHKQVERIVCGHAHRSVALRWNGTTVSVCPSTAHQFTLDLRPQSPAIYSFEPPGFQLHHWRPGTGLLTHTVQIGEFAEYRCRG
ncbi:MAG: phosphodiesterase [Alphaproteobacteria bacterium]|nr:phosphodiesterase [Alphaproteobacteria bacterium]